MGGEAGSGQPARGRVTEGGCVHSSLLLRKPRGRQGWAHLQEAAAPLPCCQLSHTEYKFSGNRAGRLVAGLPGAL